MTTSNPTTSPAAAEAAIQTISLYAPSARIQPRSVKGRFVRWRWLLVWMTQIVFYGLPWLRWNGRPAVLLELTSRRFYIFDLVLYPQDFIYLTALLLLAAYSLFFFTAIAGRLWCGYACPQTVSTEIFMWVERRIEGDRPQRMKLDAAAWTADKLLRRGGKQMAWIAIALWTGFTFVGYFTPIRVLVASAVQLSLGPWETFWVLFYAFATWGNAGYMREQVCKYMCPYARFQSAMFDRDTLIISYDAKRGEPRGARLRKSDPAAAAQGACVDCGLCVQVCPTGIDIRKGLQYECIGCAACVDACDGMMAKIGQPTGLVRYDTLNGMDEGLSPVERLKRVLRPRVLVYGTVLIAITLAVAASVALRPPFKVDVMRDRTTLSRIVDDGWIENVYRLQVMNATEATQDYAVRATGLDGLVTATPVRLQLGPAEARWVVVALRLPPQTAATLQPGSHAISFSIEGSVAPGQEGREVHERSTFVIPR